MRAWEKKIGKLLIIATVLTVIISSLTDKSSHASVPVIPGFSDGPQIECNGTSKIKDTSFTHPHYMVLENGVKLQYTNGITVYQTHKELMGNLVLELFPLNAKITYRGFVKEDLCIPRIISIDIGRNE